MIGVLAASRLLEKRSLLKLGLGEYFATGVFGMRFGLGRQDRWLRVPA